MKPNEEETTNTGDPDVPNVVGQGEGKGEGGESETATLVIHPSVAKPDGKPAETVPLAAPVAADPAPAPSALETKTADMQAAIRDGDFTKAALLATETQEILASSKSPFRDNTYAAGTASAKGQNAYVKATGLPELDAATAKNSTPDPSGVVKPDEAAEQKGLDAPEVPGVKAPGAVASDPYSKHSYL
jgi:hypothetical protein